MKMNSILRTDLAVEFVEGCKTEEIDKTIKRTDVVVDEKLSLKLNKPQGHYITIETDCVKRGGKYEFSRVSKELSKAITMLLRGKSCLVVGLGNPNMTADSLGKFVSERLTVTRHLPQKKGLPTISCICPNVLGVTGIESFDIVKGVVDKIKPDCIIVIDSLAGASTFRIASAFQVSSAGITPGSGVSNHRTRFDSDSLGVPVISIGVPLVVYASTIIEDALKSANQTIKYDDEISSLIVTPKDIDLLVEDCAEIISLAINCAFFGEEYSAL